MTDEAIEKIITTVALGIWPERACLIHGISADAMRHHKMRHPDFVMALETAEAKAEESFHSKILMHTEKQWTAAAWMLERRWPERYAKKPDTEIHVTQQQAQQAKVDVSIGPPRPANVDLKTFIKSMGEIVDNLPETKADEVDQESNGHNGTNGHTNGKG